MRGAPNDYYRFRGRVEEDGTFLGSQETSRHSYATGMLEISKDGSGLTGTLGFNKGGTTFGIRVARFTTGKEPLGVILPEPKRTESAGDRNSVAIVRDPASMRS